MSVAIRFIVLPSHAPRVRMCSHWTGWHDHTHETQTAGRSLHAPPLTFAVP
jgi:hypothetical protein